MTLGASPVEAGARFVMHGLGVCGIVCSVPKRRVGNEVFVDRFGAKAVADVTAMTGVERRFWAEEGQTAGDLCLAAARLLMSRLHWAPDSIDALVLVTQTPDQRLPATSCLLHRDLALPRRCLAFDVSLGCSGYVYGLWLAASMLAAGCRRILLLAGDTSSRLIDPLDRSTALLFGDAGSASALEYHEDAPDSHFVLGSDGGGAAHLMVAAGGFRPCPPDEQCASCGETLVMDGGEVFAFTARAVPPLVHAVLASAGRAVGEVDAFVLHQANRFMLRHLGKKLGIAAERLPVNIDRYGNTSSASIPLLLCTDLAPHVTRHPSTAVLAGFGVGFSWAAAYLALPRLTCAETLTV